MFSKHCTSVVYYQCVYSSLAMSQDKTAVQNRLSLSLSLSLFVIASYGLVFVCQLCSPFFFLSDKLHANVMCLDKCVFVVQHGYHRAALPLLTE